MIRAFLFDIGNVLVRFDFSKAYREVAPFCDATDMADALARIEDVKLQYEDGKVSRTLFLNEVFRRLHFRGTEAQFIAAWQGIFTENTPMIELVRQLSPQFPLFLLSNTNCMHVEGLFRDYRWFSHFRGGTYSHIAGASKPEPRIFEIACKEHGIHPTETFFIDDLPANIATARELGFTVHQYHPDRHTDLLEVLTTHGLTT